MVPGELIAARFEIGPRVAAGGIGAVYRGRDRHTGEPVAIKVLLDAAAPASQRVRFAREARVLAELRHPGIVRYVAHGTTPEGEAYLVMEWLEGEDLASRLARDPRPTARQSLALATAVAQALGAAHARGVVHRDVKPGNVFLVDGRLDRVKLLDFGIARAGGDAATRHATGTGVTIGTPGYMAPEQARGERDLDARVDVFALGCVLYECLAGEPAFVGESAIALLAKILLDEVPPVSERRGVESAALDALLARMLAKDPAARPRDGGDVAAQIAALGEVPDADETPTRASLLPPALTTEEQRLVAVVLVGFVGRARPGGSSRADRGSDNATDDASALAATLVDDAPRAVLIDRARTVARAHGGALDVLTDGTFVVTIAARGAAATDHAAGAARCALALRDALPDAAIALATGRGNVTPGATVTPTASGSGARASGSSHVIDRAARLLAVARPAGAVCVDALTSRLLDARFELAAGASHDSAAELRGVRDTGADARDDLSPARTLLGRPSPCVGRDRELAVLDAALDECVNAPAATVVLVTAAPGVGKSRLRDAFTRRVLARGGGGGGGDGVQVWIGRGDPMSAGSPFAIVADAVRGAAGLRAGDTSDEARARLHARVARHMAGSPREAARVAAFVGEAIGLSFPEAFDVQLRTARQDRAVMRDQVRRAFEDWLAAECAARPLLLALEDLHWGDLPSIGLVDGALRHLRERPFMVLALARPEVEDHFPKLWSERDVQHVRLGELSRRASAQLVRAVLGGARGGEARAGTHAAPDDATVARIVERAGGNAFYLEELIRAAAEGRDIGAELPETVVAMAAARLEALEPEARRVLRAASVFGEVFWAGGVAALLGGARAAGEVDAWCSALTDREVIGPRRGGAARFAGETEHAFRHALVREAAYAMLTDEDRALGHRLAGAWLEGAGEHDALALAEHFERGGDPARAAGWYKRAADQALEGNDLSAAVARAERGLRCAGDSQPSGALRASLELVVSQAWRGRGDEALAGAAAGRAAAHAVTGSTVWFQAVRESLAIAGRGLDRPRFGALVAAVLAAPCEEAARPFALHALVWAEEQAVFNGWTAELADIQARVDALAPWAATADPASVARIDYSRATRAYARGETGAYLRGQQRLVASLDRAGDLRQACLQRANTADAFIGLGAYEDAEALLAVALAEAERLGWTALIGAVQLNTGRVRAARGEFAQAQALIARAVACYEAIGDVRMVAATRLGEAVVLQQAGDLAGAERAARAVVGSQLEGALRAHALATLAGVLLAQGQLAEARRHADEAADLLDALEGAAIEGEAAVRLVHAQALEAAGESARAREVIAAAAARVRALAERIDEPALRASFLTRVPEHAATLALERAWASGG